MTWPRLVAGCAGLAAFSALSLEAQAPLVIGEAVLDRAMARVPQTEAVMAESLLGQCYIELSATQEDLAVVRAQSYNVQAAFDAYRVQQERARLTPQCGEAQAFDWARDPSTNRPYGCR